MSRSYAYKFRGMESAVIGTVLAYGFSEAARIYGVTHRKSFENWIKERTGGILFRGPFDNWRGGEKHQFLCDNREFILRCCDKFGCAWVERTFHIQPDTLSNFFHAQGKLKRKFSTAERALLMAEASIVAVNELRRDVKNLQEAYSQFTKTIGIQVGAKIAEAISSGLEHNINPGDISTELDKPDISVAGLLKQGREWQQKSNHSHKDSQVSSEQSIKNVYLQAHPLARS